MGGWIWDDMVDRLTGLDHDARTMTLPGCRPDDSEASAVSLADHVNAVVAKIEEIGDDVVLVGHSYSGLVVGQVADRLGRWCNARSMSDRSCRETAGRCSMTGATAPRSVRPRNSK